MPGTHYTLDRDRKDPPPPKEKPCKKCHVVKPNDFAHFGKKWYKTRTNYVPNDVCHDCHKATISEGMKRRWAERQGVVPAAVGATPATQVETANMSPENELLLKLLRGEVVPGQEDETP